MVFWAHSLRRVGHAGLECTWARSTSSVGWFWTALWRTEVYHTSGVLVIPRLREPCVLGGMGSDCRSMVHWCTRCFPRRTFGGIRSTRLVPKCSGETSSGVHPTGGAKRSAILVVTTKF